jgi:hypothetical protein
MRRGRGTVRRWLAALALAPLVVAAVASSSAFALRCRITGMVSLEVCCPGAGDDGAGASDGAPQATIADAGCCERVVLTSAKPPADEPGHERLAALPLCIDVARVADAAPPTAFASRADHAAGPPATAPPLYLAKHAFLI